jgi:hypothetical protein
MAITLTLFSRFAFAENVDDLKKKLALDQTKLVVMENLTLSDEESAMFWPAFRDFQDNLYKLDTQYFQLVSFYLKKYKEKSLSDEEATKMIDAYFTILESRRRLVKDFAFVLEMGKILPVKKIFRYLQIQQGIDAVDQYEISQKIPLLQ